MPLFRRSELTDAIVRYLCGFDEGGIVNYNELSRIVGVKITSASSHLASAKRILRDEFSQIWRAVPNIGVRRLNHTQSAEALRKERLARARRQIAVGGKEANTVETSQLDIDTQARFRADCIVREYAAQLLSSTMRKRLDRVSRGTSNDLPSFNATEWAISLSPRHPR
jgi:glutamyl-tRNA reductase